MDTSLLTINGLRKTFPGCIALAGLDLEIRRGEVLALVGQNGCGKSTFIKILSGFHQPDSGYDANFSGEPLHLGDSDSALRHGIHFVHQDLALLADLSAVENLAIGAGFATGAGLIKWREQRRRTQAALGALGYDFDVTVPVRTLSPSQRVGVAIARAMSDADDGLALLVLDEPTASLPQAEVDTLFEAVRKLADAGTSVLFVSHRLDEVFAVADRVTVMRDGRAVATSPTGDLDQKSLIALILGRSVDLDHVEPTAQARGTEPLFRIRGLCGRHLVDFDLDAYPGEVIGITGLTGSGREELAPLLFGARRWTNGSVEIQGRPIARLTPPLAKALGIALVSADRRASAVIGDASVGENLTLADLGPLTRRLLVRGRRERIEVDSWLETLNVKPRRGDESILNLSGGNQQKVMLARWMRLLPRIFILDEPTQGVDVGTKPEIYALLRGIADGGATVVVCSTDSEEIVEVSDRVLVLSGGRVHAELCGAALTMDRLNHEIVAA